MKFCSKCGKEIHDDAAICIHCGCAVSGGNSVVDTQDAPNLGFAILGFFIPLVGLIMYLMWHGTKPKQAASAGKGALIGFVVSIVFSIIYGAIVGSVLGSMMYY